ncbi:MAG: SGNH/GDSL hydrolase family protein [Candidatus Omnitrophica bacterium]|nr:SGNH/GDSL hydrolase family protein [Candidatus Omnitrophota bacterium]
MKKERNKLKNFLVLFMSLIFLFLALELVIRVFSFSMPELVEDSKLGDGYSLFPKPYSRYFYFSEGYSRGKYNRFGLRDYDSYSLKKGKGVCRIIVVGDSFVEALQVDLADTFENITERLLNNDSSLKKKYSSFEVINCGRSGWGTAQQYLWYEKNLKRFNPDIVVLAFYIGNDFNNNVYQWERLSETKGGGRPYIVFDEKGNWHIEYIDKPSGKLRGVLRKSDFFRFINERITVFNLSFVKGVYGGKEAFSDNLIDEYQSIVSGARIYPRLEFLIKNKSSDFLSKSEQSLKLIELFHKAVSEDGHKFLFMAIPWSMQIVESVFEPLFNSVGDDLFDIQWPNNYLAEFNKKMGIEQCLLLEPFSEFYSLNHKSPYGFSGNIRGHFNKDGHRVTADLLYQHLKSILAN